MKSFSLSKPIVAAHWNQSSLAYVVADRKGGQVHVLGAGTVRRDIDEDDDRSPGEVLAAELEKLGCRRCELLVALGRGDVDVIPLQLPPASDEELPTLVANQVMRDAGEIAETGIVDYVALPAEPDQPRTGLAFAVDAVTIEQMLEEARRASTKLVAVVYRALASVTLLQRVVPSSPRTMLLVTIHNSEADISVVRGGTFVYTRTARLNETQNVGDVAAQLAVEVRRSLAAASLTPDAEDQHLYMFGALQETEQLVQELAEELSLPASLLDPLRSELVEGPTPESVGRLSPLLGMVHDHFAQSHAVDFLHPKEPPAPPSHARRYASYAVAALVLAAIGGYWLWDVRAKSAADIADLRRSLERTTVQLERVQSKKAVVDAVQLWHSNTVNWLDEFYDLARRFPSGRDAVIRRFSVSPGRGRESHIDLSVQVRDPEVIDQLGDQLRDAYHDVRNSGVSEKASTGDYPWQFETRITLRPRGTEEYRKESPPAETEKPLEGEIASTTSR